MGKHKKRRHSETESDDESEDSSASESMSDSESSSEEEKKRSHKKKHKKEKKKKKRKKSKKSRRRSVDERLTSKDYFLKNRELRLWLQEEKTVFFEDLTSEKARSYFNDFVKLWNKGKLDEKYYKGQTSGVRSQQDRTRHSWNISGINKRTLGSVVSEVTSLTDDQSGFGPPVPATGSTAVSASKPSAAGPSKPASVRTAPVKALVGPMLPPGFQPQREDAEEERAEKHRSVAEERRRRAEFHREAIETMLPKASGHEAKVEKRKAAAERRRARGDSPDVDYARVQRGGGNIEKVIAARKHARETRLEQKQHLAAEKLREYEEKERDRMAEILQMAKSNQSRGALWQPKGT
eukprot:scpid22261/ scgid21859/ 